MPKVACACLQCKKEFEQHECYVRRGQGKFCSISCGTTYRNLHNNSTNNPKTKLKISQNHADVSGSKNPMYGRKGKLAPSYIDGRNSIGGDIWRKIALVNKPPKCEMCGEKVSGRKLHVHHKDKDRKNNILLNLQILCSKCHNNKIHVQQRDANGCFLKGVV